MDRLVIPVVTPATADVIAELVRRPDLEVIGVAVDVTGDGGLDALRDAALAAGARRCHVVDKCEVLAEAVLWPALRAGALAVPGEPVLTALSMPAVAEAVVEVCRHEQASGVAVWLDDRRDRQRLRALIRDLAPTLGLVSITGAAPATATRNLWARIDVIDAPASAADEVVTVTGARPTAAGTTAVTIGFDRGLPMSLNGVPLPPAELVASLATIVGDGGARAWTVRGGATGRSWRVQAPAALALALAMEALTARTLDARTAEVAATMAEAYAEVIRDGAWFSPVRAGIDAFVDRVLAGAAGDVGLRIVNGQIEVQA